ncbi:MAG: hypothetical protein AB7F40_00130 [Victivallaceae bacterium]|nr:hypothetical protein [Victivallaceae bacterium]
MANHSGQIPSGETIVISTGEIAAETIIRPNATMFVSGGTASGTTIYYNGTEFLDNGGIDYGAIVSGADSGYCPVLRAKQEIYNSGLAIDAELMDYGRQDIYFGGIASGTKVAGAGMQMVYYGGTAVGTLLSGTIFRLEDSSYWYHPGQLEVFSRGTASAAVVYSMGEMTISAGGLSIGAVISGGWMCVAGEAVSTWMGDYGTVIIRDGGMLRNTICDHANMTISNGRAEDTVLLGGWQDVCGGTAVRTTIMSDGIQSITNTTVQSTIIIGGQQYIGFGGVADSTVVGASSFQDVYSDGAAFRTTLSSGGAQYVSRGGYAWKTVIGSGGRQLLFSGAVAVDIFIASGGECYCYTGTVIEGNLTVGGSVVIWDGGPADLTQADIILLLAAPDTTVFLNGMDCFTKANSYTVKSDSVLADGKYILGTRCSGFEGVFTVIDGGIKLGEVSTVSPLYTEDSTYSLMIVSSSLLLMKSPPVHPVRLFLSGAEVGHGKVISGAVLGNGGPVDSMYISSGGVAYDTLLMTGGTQTVWGAASGVMVSSGGKINVYSGGTALDVHIGSGGSGTVICNGRLSSRTVVDAGGVMTVTSGGIVSGKLEVAGSLVMYTGGILSDCELTIRLDRSNPDSRYLISNAAAFSGNDYSVVVADDQMEGAYKIISGGDRWAAYNLTLINSAGDVLGTVTRESGVFVGNKFYSMEAVGFYDVVLGVYSDAPVKLYKHGELTGYRNTVSSIAVMAGGNPDEVVVTSGGTAYGMGVHSGGLLRVESGGMLLGPSIYMSGSLEADGGSIISAGFHDNSCSFLAKGQAVISSTSICGSAHVTNSVMISIGVSGDLIADFDTRISSLSVGGLGSVRIFDSIASGVTVNSGSMHVGSGSYACDVKTGYFGYVSVASGGMVENVSLHKESYLSVDSGGVANNVTIAYESHINLNEGAEVRGNFVFSNKINLYGRADLSSAEVVINLTSGLAVPGGLISRMDYFDNAASYTIRCDVRMDINTFIIASSGASGFDRGITIIDNGVLLGILTLRNTIVQDRDTYSLAITEQGALTMTKTHDNFPVQVYDSYGRFLCDFATVSGYDFSISSGNCMEICDGGSAVYTSNTRLQNIRSGGYAELTFINGGGLQQVFSGGIAVGTHIICTSGHSASQKISGGVASGTVLAGMAMQNILTDGKAFDTLILDGAVQYINVGGFASGNVLSGPKSIQSVCFNATAQSTEIGSGCAQNVDGSAYATTIYSGGVQRTLLGGLTEDIAVKSGGKLSVAHGATIIRAVLEEGAILGYDFDVVIDASSAGSQVQLINSRSCDFEVRGGFHTVSCNYLSLRADILDVGEMRVLSGGIASSAHIHSSGVMSIGYGGTAYGTLAAGSMFVGSGGKIYDTVVKPDDETMGAYSTGLTVSSGGTAYSTLLSARMLVSGRACDTVVNNGYLYVSGGGTISNTALNGGMVIVSSGGIAYATEVNSGEIRVFGSAESTILYTSMYCLGNASNTHMRGSAVFSVSSGSIFGTIISGGINCLYRNAIASDTVICGGIQYLSDGSRSTGTTISTGIQIIYSECLAENTIVSCGIQSVCWSGRADSTTVLAGGSLIVDDCGSATNVNMESGATLAYGFNAHLTVTSAGTVISGVEKRCLNYTVHGYQLVSSGYVALNTLIYGAQSVLAGGYTSSAVLLYDEGIAHQDVYGIAEYTSISSGAVQNVNSGGIAVGTVIYSKGVESIFKGGKADGALVEFGGVMHLDSAQLSGKIVVRGSLDAYSPASVESGCTIMVDPDGRAAYTGSAMIGNAARFSGVEWGLSAECDPGSYVLFSSGAEIWNGSDGGLAVYSGGELKGYLWSGNTTLTVGQKHFVLSIADENTAQISLSVQGSFKSYSGHVSNNAANLSLRNATVSQLVTGTENDVSNASTLLNLEGENTCNIYGGGNNVNVNNSIALALQSGRYTGTIYGGSRANAQSITTGNIVMTIGEIVHANNLKLLKYGASAWAVGGGGAFSGGTIAVGNVNMTVSGTVGGYLAGGAQAEGAGSIATVKSTNIVVRNATISGDVFGGGYAHDSGVSIVSGSSSLCFDTTYDSINIQGSIYAGGANPSYRSTGGSSVVNGDTVVTFTGAAERLSIGMVSGDGKQEGSVYGSRIVKFADFTGEFAGTLRNFDVVCFSGDTTVSGGGGFAADTFVFDMTGRDNPLCFADGFRFGNNDGNLLKIELGNSVGDFDLMTCENEAALEGLQIELYRSGALFASFEFGESQNGYTVKVAGGMLSVMG